MNDVSIPRINGETTTYSTKKNNKILFNLIFISACFDWSVKINYFKARDFIFHVVANVKWTRVLISVIKWEITVRFEIVSVYFETFIWAIMKLLAFALIFAFFALVLCEHDAGNPRKFLLTKLFNFLKCFVTSVSKLNSAMSSTKQGWNLSCFENSLLLWLNPRRLQRIHLRRLWRERKQL